MDGNPTEQVLIELFPYLEALETRSTAILQLLKDKGVTTAQGMRVHGDFLVTFVAAVSLERWRCNSAGSSSARVREEGLLRNGNRDWMVV